MGEGLGRFGPLWETNGGGGGGALKRKKSQNFRSPEVSIPEYIYTDETAT